MEKNIPNHVVIIPDGNRRWASEQNLKPWEGHEEGAKNVEKLTRYCLDKGVNCLTFWGSSIDNLTKRPVREKMALLDIYQRYFQSLIDGKDIYENEVKVNIIGRWEEQFPEALKKTIRDLIEKTKHFEKKALNFMLAYSGKDDLICAVEKIKNKLEKNVQITAEVIKENLMTKDLASVDYMIRTGGEPHLSDGFMMWDTQNSQLYFSEKNFPDFNEEEMEKSLEDYSRRGRRFGK